MTLRTNIELIVNLSQISCKRLIREGYFRFSLNLYYVETGQTQKIVCSPFNIIKNNLSEEPQAERQHIIKSSKALFKNQQGQGLEQLPESKIDNKTEQYYSPIFFMNCRQATFKINQTCCFKAYVDSEKFNRLYKNGTMSKLQEQEIYPRKKLLQDDKKVSLKCQSKLYFSQSLTDQRFIQIGCFTSEINRLSSVGCFLHLTFDSFAGFQVCGTFHSTILQFQFEAGKKNGNFHSYLGKNSNFQEQKIRNFYNFYRGALEEELTNLQERFYKFLEIIVQVRQNQQNQQKQTQRYKNQNISCQNYDVQNQQFDYRISASLKKQVASLKFSQKLGKFTAKSPQKTHNEASYKQLLKTFGALQHKKMVQIPVNTKIIKKLQKISKKSEEGTKQIAQLIAEDFLSAKRYLYEHWSEYLTMIHDNSDCLTEHLKKQYNELVKQRFKSNIFSHKITNHDRSFCKYQDSGKSHIQCSIKEKSKGKQQSNRQLWHESHPVQNHQFFEGENSIKFFEQIYLSEEASQALTSSATSFRENFQLKNLVVSNKSKLNSKSSFEKLHSLQKIQTEKTIQMKGNKKMHNKKHLIVLVHGFQASRLDFRKLKSCLQINYQNVQVMLSFSNEERTHQSIQILGKRLAVQIATFLMNLQSSQGTGMTQTPSVSIVDKISFIGHSMGGLIIRSALVYLKNLQDKLFTYISICTPHLGYLYQPAPLVQAGLWLMNTWNKCESINQLSMEDFDSSFSIITPKEQKMKSSFLYKLSKKKTLKYFKNICFMTSSQDQYVPYESARVEKNMKLLSQMRSTSNTEKKIIAQMVDAIFQDLSQVKQVSRVDVIFSDIQKNFDSFIGRTAHVIFLSNEQFIKQFVMCFDKFFK